MEMMFVLMLTAVSIGLAALNNGSEKSHRKTNDLKSYVDGDIGNVQISTINSWVATNSSSWGSRNSSSWGSGDSGYWVNEDSGYWGSTDSSSWGSGDSGCCGGGDGGC